MSQGAFNTRLGPILGPLIGGYLMENFSWQWVFYIKLPVGALAMLGNQLAFAPVEHDLEYAEGGSLTPGAGSGSMSSNKR